MYLSLWNSETISSFLFLFYFLIVFIIQKLKEKKNIYIYIYMFFYLLSEKAEDIFIWHAYINE